MDHLKGIGALLLICFFVFTKKEDVENAAPPSTAMAASIQRAQFTPKKTDTTVIDIEAYHQFQLNYFKENIPTFIPQNKRRYYLSPAFLREVRDAYLKGKN
jgi:hypothetical protein